MVWRKCIEKTKESKPCRRSSTLFIHAALIIASIFLLTYVDFIVLEKIHHPIAAKYSVNWADFNATIFKIKIPVIWWQFAFIPLGVCLFTLLGIAAKSFRLFFSGVLLFATGWEDILYYAIQGKWLPRQLSWLDYSPIMGLTKFLTSTEHVTSTGILISSLTGLIVSCLILLSVNPFSHFKQS
jgi:hypothetical protein